MSDHLIVPQSLQELKDIVASEPLLLAVGNRTKPPMSAAADAKLVSLRAIVGMIQYEPSEFTFTAFSGTRVSEVVATLAERNQYLPFDPMLVEAGATLGGTVASGLAGPGRFRYGGIRDFLLGVQFLSGDGNVINAGGKVVKNAAGFDIPKLMVGSLGRLGVMTQFSFKVFPRPVTTKTLLVQCASDAQGVQRIAQAAASRWELDAIDYRPSQQAMFLRLAGPKRVNDAIADEIQSLWGKDVVESVSPGDFWRSICEMTWSPGSETMIKIASTPSQFIKLRQTFDGHPGIHIHWSVAGGVLWIAVDDPATYGQLAKTLRSMNVCGLVVRGSETPCMIGSRSSSEMETAIKHAMDPSEKFPVFAMSCT